MTVSLKCSLLAMLCAGGPLCVKAQAAALLPTATVSTAMPDLHGAVIKVAPRSDLQAAINSAKPGDQILISAGATFSGSYVLPAKSGTDWIIIKSDGALPQPGTRVGPANVSAMATIQAPGSNQPAIQTAAGAQHYRLIGLNITAAPSVTQMTSLVNLGSGGSDQKTVGSQPKDIILDRVFIHGTATLDVRRGVSLNSANTAVVDSSISDIHSAGQDAQAIGGWNGTGPYRISNNLLEGSGENIMFGGADPQIPNALPQDIVISDNMIQKPAAWRGKWLVKNLLELKIGNRVLIENNTLQNNWVDGQAGFAVNFKSTDQNNTAPWSTTANVTFRNNLVRNSPAGISLGAKPDPGTAIPAAHFNISGNVFRAIGGTVDAPTGALFQLIGAGGSLGDVTISSNQAVQAANTLNSTIVFDGSPTTGLVLTSNVITQGLYGIKGSGLGEGAATLNFYAPGATFTNNVLIGGIAANYVPFASQNLFTASQSNLRKASRERAN